MKSSSAVTVVASLVSWRRTVSNFHCMIGESINLDEPISDIDVLVNRVTNVDEHWELDIDSSNWTLI